MNKKLLVLVGMFIFMQTAFSLSCVYRGYRKEVGKVYYFKGSKKIELTNADFDTFEIVKAVNFSILARDKNNIYYDGKLLKDIDVNTFLIKKEIKPNDIGPWKYGCGASGYIIKDKNKTYKLEEVFE